MCHKSGFIETVKSQNTIRSFGDVNQFREELIVALQPFKIGPEQEKQHSANHSARDPIPLHPIISRA